MKKLLALLVLLALPICAFADFQIGAVGMYKGGFPPTPPISLHDFTYGAEARMTFGIIQGGASLLYFPSVAPAPADILALFDVGLNLNLAILDVGVGLGPNFMFPINAPGTATKGGINVKLAAEVNIGNLSIGAVGFYYLNSFRDLSGGLGLFKAARPALGVTALLKVF